MTDLVTRLRAYHTKMARAHPSICDAAAAEIERLSAALAAERARADALAKENERLREAFKLADSIASEAMRWGYYASDEAIAVLVNARALTKEAGNG